MSSSKNSKILIVDNDLSYQKVLETLLNDLEYQQVQFASTFDKGVEMFLSFRPDILILDVVLDHQKSGISFIKEIEQYDHNIPIIFLTALFDNEHYEKAKSVKPSQFLEKNLDPLDLQQAIELSLQKFRQFQTVSQSQNKLLASPKPSPLSSDAWFIKKKKLYTKVPLESITAIQSEGKYLVIYTAQNEKFMITQTMAQAIEILKEWGFIRIHRAWIVNKSKITAIDTSSYQVRLGKQSYPIGRSFRQAVFDEITTF